MASLRVDRRNRAYGATAATVKSLLLCLVMVGAALLPSLAHAQQPPFVSQGFYGAVTVGGQPAEVNTVIVARVDGVERGKVVVTLAGKYGGPNPFDAKLVVQGFIPDGSAVLFYVNEVQANETALFISRATTRVDLTAPSVSDITASILIGFPASAFLTTATSNPAVAGRALAGAASLDAGAAGKALTSAALQNALATGKGLAAAAGVDPAAAGKALAAAAQQEPAAVGSALVAASAVDASAVGSALAAAAVIDAIAVGKVIASAAMTDALAMGKVLANAAERNPGPTGVAWAAAAAQNPAAAGKALIAASAASAATGNALAAAAAQNATATGGALAIAAAQNPGATGNALTKAVGVNAAATGLAIAAAAAANPVATGGVLARAAAANPSAAGSAVAAAAAQNPPATGNALVNAGAQDLPATGEAVAIAAAQNPAAVAAAIASATATTNATAAGAVLSAAAAKDPIAAASVFERVPVEQAATLVPKMSQAALTKMLPEMSAARVYGIPAKTLLEALPAIPAEKLVGEVPPAASPDLPPPVAGTITSTEANYTVLTSASGQWASLVQARPPITKVLVKTKTAISNISTRLAETAVRPPEIALEPPGGRFGNYLQISVLNARPEDIEVGYVAFAVDKSWIAANSIHKWSIELLEWDATWGQWVALGAKRVSEDDKSLHFSAAVPKFSYFAITGQQSPPEAPVTASDLRVEPAEVKAGEPVTISVDLTRVAQGRQVINLDLWVNGTIDDSQVVAVDADRVGTASFSVVKNVAGDYEVRVDRLFGSFRVVSAPPPPAATPTPAPTATPVVTILPTPEPSPAAGSATPVPVQTPVPEATPAAGTPLPPPSPLPLPAPAGFPIGIVVWLIVAVVFIGGAIYYIKQTWL